MKSLLDVVSWVMVFIAWVLYGITSKGTMNPIEETVCAGCGKVNPGGLKEYRGRILCPDCRPRDYINENNYRLLVLECRKHRIQDPKSKQITEILGIGEQQAQAYRRTWKARHPEQYPAKEARETHIIGKAVKGLPLLGPAPELTKAINDEQRKENP